MPLVRSAGRPYGRSMDDQNEQDDWVEGGCLEAQADGLTLFSGQCFEIDTAGLPDPPEPNVA